MTRTYTHELNQEVQTISGWYELHKEERIELMGKGSLYVVGHAVVDSSCCGIGGCHYAVVPGSIVSWKSGTNEAGLFTSVVEPIRDEEVQEELHKILTEKEGVSQVLFW
jgi:hypothetical protein